MSASDALGSRQFKTRYHVSEVGMVPPPGRGFGQIDPELHEKLKARPRGWAAIPSTPVPLGNPVRASQETVSKRKVDRTRGPAAPEGDRPKASPFNGGVHLYDGHHRTAAAMKRGDSHIPMDLYDPDNPMHVEHAAKVNAEVSALRDPLNDHRFQVIREHGFFGAGKKEGPEHDAARAAFMAHQNEVHAKIDRIQHNARQGWRR